MNKQDFKFKLRWWLKEHFLFGKSPLQGEVTLQYSMPEEYGDFAVHPCVRFIKEGIGGYKWWLALSPYPNYDIKKENILLFHGINEMDSEPPVEWKFVKEVCGTHKDGFNSDPNLYYDGESLWIVWREWETENLPAGVPIVCTMCSKTKDGVTFTKHEVIAHNEFNEYSMQGDTSMCPIVYKYKEDLCMYASLYAYEPHLTPIGTSRYIYDNDKQRFCLDGFHHSETVPFDLWHFDLFEYNGYLYQVITGQFGNAVYIGRSRDGKVFKYCKKPLYANPWFLKKNFFYKPSAQIIGTKLYVFFPRKKENGALRIVMRSMDVRGLEKFDYR
jgi:hypothetical protein